MTIYKDMKQVVPAGNPSPVETGPLFVVDNPSSGVFIQADHAVYFSVMLKQVLGSYGKAKSDKDMIALNEMGNLVTLLESCNEK